MTLSSACYAVVGLGQTGLSCARYLSSRGCAFFFVDTRDHPPGIETARQLYPSIAIHTGVSDDQCLLKAESMIVSPGVPLDTPMVKNAVQAGVELLSDIDLFCMAVDAPIIGITGSNGKSTVTTLIGAMAKSAKINVAVGGNIGLPVLDLLSKKELYVLELSSFQLERVKYLKTAVAVFLNVSPDHLDVHHTLDAYVNAKQVIFKGAVSAVCNQEDKQTWPKYEKNINLNTFTCKAPKRDQFGLIKKNNQCWIAYGDELLLCESELKLAGLHNLLNAAAAMTVGKIMGFPVSAMLQTLRAFSGLDHRCQWVARKKGVDWFNDSKGTNEAASMAAIEGLSSSDKKNIVLIAGGDGKGSTFIKLAEVINKHVKYVVLFGRDAEKIQVAIQNATPVYNVDSLEKAISCAERLASSGDCVLLSPACTSWDMFSSYQERGKLFTNQVLSLDNQ